MEEKNFKQLDLDLTEKIKINFMIHKIFIYLDHIFVSIFSLLFYLTRFFFSQLDQVNNSSIIQNKMKRTTLTLIFCACLFLALFSNGLATNCFSMNPCKQKETCVQWLRDCGPTALNCAKKANKDSQLYNYFPQSQWGWDLTPLIDAATRNMDYQQVISIQRIVKKELAKHILNNNRCW